MTLSYEKFNECIKQFVAKSDKLDDGWQLQHKLGVENGTYATKKDNQCLQRCSSSSLPSSHLLVVFEYHVVYSVNYGVPVLCFIAWKQDGSLLQIEEYCEYNERLAIESDILSTLTQLDHPVLCRPFLTLHPCKTTEIMQAFMNESKNPIASWLSTIGPFLDLKVDERYMEIC